VKQDLIERDMHCLPVGDWNRLGSCQGRCSHQDQFSSESSVRTRARIAE
jgi:hypothetical protein